MDQRTAEAERMCLIDVGESFVNYFSLEDSEHALELWRKLVDSGDIQEFPTRAAAERAAGG